MAAANTTMLVTSVAVVLLFVIASLAMPSMRRYLRGWIMLGVAMGATLLVDQRLVPKVSFWPIRIISAVLAIGAGVHVYRAWVAERLATK